MSPKVHSRRGGVEPLIIRISNHFGDSAIVMPMTCVAERVSPSRLTPMAMDARAVRVVSV